MITILAEKDSQALDYYIGLTDDKSITLEQAKRQGFLTVKQSPIFHGETAIVTWAKGHLTELQEPDEYDPNLKVWSLDTLPIIPEKFKYKAKVNKDGKINRQFNIVSEWLNKANTIIWAGDNDREGSYISYTISMLCGVWKKPNVTFKSLWIDDLSPKVVKKGFSNLKDIELRYNQAIEAQSRAQSDWLLGMNGSRTLALLLQKKLGLRLGKNQGKIATGRIISPLLFMVYRREMEIANFVPKKYYELEATFEHANGSYIGKYIVPEITMTKGYQKGNKWKGTFDTKEQWNKLIANPRFFEDTSKGNIIDVDTSIKYSRSPALFSLSDLQKFFDKKLNLSPTEVQDICQELYEKDKVTTYPRTSSNHISTERFNTLCKDLNKMSSLLSVSNELVNIPEKSDGFFVNNKKSEVHAALTPTEVFPTGPQFQQWSSSKKAVYIEILKRTLAMFLPKYAYEQTTIITEVTPALFKTIGKVPKSPGWKILWKDNDMLFDKDEVEPKTLIKVLNGDPVKPILNPIEKNISKPQPYSLGGLIGAMETAGRDFDDDELRKVMKETQGLGTEATRAKSIQTIQDYQWIALKKGKVYLTPLGRLICESIQSEKLLSDAETTAVWEQSLRKVGTGEKTQEWFVGNIKKYLGVDNPNNNLINNLQTWIMTYDYSKYAEWLNDTSKKSNGEVGACPKCGGTVIYLTKSANCKNSLLSKEDKERGKHASCDFWLPLSIASKKLSSKQISDLLLKKETKVIKGFKSKQDKAFDAKLKLGEDNKLTFDFPQKAAIKEEQ